MGEKEPGVRFDNIRSESGGPTELTVTLVFGAPYAYDIPNTQDCPELWQQFVVEVENAVQNSMNMMLRAIEIARTQWQTNLTCSSCEAVANIRVMGDKKMQQFCDEIPFCCGCGGKFTVTEYGVYDGSDIAKDRKDDSAVGRRVVVLECSRCFETIKREVIGDKEVEVLRVPSFTCGICRGSYRIKEVIEGGSDTTKDRKDDSAVG